MTVTDVLSVNGVDLAWHEWGTGRTLLLCHGFTGSSHDFSLHTEALAATRRVVTLDQRGHGKSTNTHDASTYTMDQLVSDLTTFMEKVGGGPIDLLGHSMGGMVVMRAALARPDLINSLILMDTSAWSARPLDKASQDLVTQFLAVFDPERGMSLGLNFRAPEDDLIETATSPEWRAEKDEMFLSVDAYAYKALGSQLFNDRAISVRAELPRITCPTTVLVGELDHPFVDQSEALASEVAHGQLVVIPGAYHSPQLTHQAEWRAEVEAHLARVAP
ncbi:MAG TPA: alpha/beta hydrolase [Acidimicrobiales bacterium]|nr:alpha/beta hydrolase [Acidimicrobiales bacterium]